MQLLVRNAENITPFLNEIAVRLLQTTKRAAKIYECLI